VSHLLGSGPDTKSYLHAAVKRFSLRQMRIGCVHARRLGSLSLCFSRWHGRGVELQQWACLLAAQPASSPDCAGCTAARNRKTAEHQSNSALTIVLQVVKVTCQKAAMLPHMDGSTIFTRLQQCSPHLHYVSKKRPTFTTCYNFYTHSSIATIFHTNFVEKVGNQNALYFPTKPT